MNPEQISGLITSLGTLFSALLWPMLVAILALRFGPVLLRKFVESDQITLKAAGIEASFQRVKVEVAAALGAAANAKNEGVGSHETLDPERLARDVDRAVPNAEAYKRLGGSSLLWVDDRPANNRYERLALEAMGIRVEIALSTDEAIQRTGLQAFDLIISDMGRPGDARAGYTLLDRLRESGLRTPFVIYSGSRLPEHVAEARRHGALGCTNSPSELISFVAEALEKRS
ncbi:response regulator [Arthrobacter bambusae]|uniref:response regulator n=1 Tax=Arthrobacter bambusae TaxID=1338426 RepID=UPI0027803BFC|nr:response regulator [Arthrobacter bambusae]MDQ0210920.1 CheY-like chemotaxis protein [Arthrobacter bambusae]MDQ0236046.1 CheY-like chemotaxis protein [Arthrobacter bambusae]